MPGHDLTIKVVYVRKTSGGSSVQIESPNKPKQDNSLKFNTEDHFAYVNGYPDGTVKPTGDVTRAEVAAILYRVMDADCVKTYETTRCSFSDVVRGDWFNLYVATLENAGVIVDTRTNGKFRPNEAITRAELAAMLAQFADIKSAANSFNDVSARHWASDEIAVCAKMGWINGYPDGSFRPDATITRAEMMAMINRALGRTPKSADDLLSGMKTWRDNANVNAWYYSCPATTERNGGSSERSSEGCKTRERCQPPFSRCLGSGKKRRTGASIKISKAGAALRFTEPPRG